MAVLTHKKVEQNAEFVCEDIPKTVPEYMAQHPELKISLLDLDTNIYEPAVTIPENLYSRIVKGSVLILDNYGTFPGETKAVDDYFKARDVCIQKFSFCMTQDYIIKNNI
jgi:hypothetical protein